MTNSFLKYVLIASITPSSSGFLPTSLNMLWSPLRAHLYIFILIFLFYFFFCHLHVILFLFFYFTLFYFTILYWFCHTSTWICHGCTWVPDREPPSHLLPYIISLGHPRAPAPSLLSPVSNIDWQFVSYMIVYMFQCHSPKSSHPLPVSPKVRSTHLCLFCCLTYRVIYTSVSLLLSHIQAYHYHLSKFHTYVLVYCIGVFLSGLLHCA